MDAQDHPHFVHIPDPDQVEGVRAYAEPAVAHPLQMTFLEESGEHTWVGEMRDLLCAGSAAEADARLTAGLVGFDGTLARLCRATPATGVTLEGWEDLAAILAEWERPAITALTLGLTNPPDLVFEHGVTHQPELLLGPYSDDTFDFTSASKAELLAECANELPGWSGAEEDVEFYCSLTGLAELNTALINCKHRRFLRDGRDGVEGRAPGGYVEYVLGSWLLATRFLQAVQRATADASFRLIVGTVDVNADFVTVLGPDAPARPVIAAAPAEPAFAPLTFTPWVPKEDPTADALASGPTLRQRIKSVEPEPVEQPRPGFLARLFGRFAKPTN